MTRSRMTRKSALVLFACALTCGDSLTATNATRLEIRHGKFQLAQTYCQMCRDARTTCILKCNGAGTCIQRCEDEFLDCIEYNCSFRRF
jgi:hypothetical protein